MNIWQDSPQTKTEMSMLTLSLGRNSQLWNYRVALDLWFLKTFLPFFDSAREAPHGPVVLHQDAVSTINPILCCHWQNCNATSILKIPIYTQKGLFKYQLAVLAIILTLYYQTIIKSSKTFCSVSCHNLISKNQLWLSIKGLNVHLLSTLKLGCHCNYKWSTSKCL